MSRIVEQYQARCSVSGMGFCPLVYETTGAWSTPATKFVRQWARALVMKSGSPASQTLRSLAWSVSALIARAVGDHLASARGLQPLRLENAPNIEVDGEFEGSRAIEEGPLNLMDVDPLPRTECPKSVEEGRVIGLLVASDTDQAKDQGTGPAPRHPKTTKDNLSTVDRVSPEAI